MVTASRMQNMVEFRKTNTCFATILFFRNVWKSSFGALGVERPPRCGHQATGAIQWSRTEDLGTQTHWKTCQKWGFDVGPDDTAAVCARKGVMQRASPYPHNPPYRKHAVVFTFTEIYIHIYIYIYIYIYISNLNTIIATVILHECLRDAFEFIVMVMRCCI